MKLVKNDKSGSDYGLIGQGINVSGDISFGDQLQVEGKVVGKVTSSDGTLVIGETGQLQAQVDVGVCVVHGSLYGDVIAKSRVEMRKTGKLHGDVITPVLLVEEGAVFNGAIRMGQDGPARLLEEVLVGEVDGERRIKGA